VQSVNGRKLAVEEHPPRACASQAAAALSPVDVTPAAQVQISFRRALAHIARGEKF